MAAFTVAQKTNFLLYSQMSISSLFSGARFECEPQLRCRSTPLRRVPYSWGTLRGLEGHLEHTCHEYRGVPPPTSRTSTTWLHSPWHHGTAATDMWFIHAQSFHGWVSRWEREVGRQHWRRGVVWIIPLQPGKYFFIYTVWCLYNVVNFLPKSTK